MTSQIRLQTLTREVCESWSDSLVALLHQGSGWGRDELLMELPRKWELSLVAFQVAPIGLLVASVRALGSIHIHEIVVDAKFRRQSVGRMLVQAVFEGNPDQSVSLKVHEANVEAIRFYRSMGFSSGELSGEYRWMRRPPP